MYMNKNPRLAVQSGDLVAIDWNESSMLDQQHSMFQNNIMHGSSHTPTNWVYLMFPRRMVYFQEIKQTFHMLKISHGSTMFLKMKNCHKLDLFFIFVFPPLTTNSAIESRPWLE